MRGSILQSWDGRTFTPKHRQNRRASPQISVARLCFSSYDQIPTGFTALDDFLDQITDLPPESDLKQARKDFASNRINRKGHETLADLRLLSGFTQAQFSEMLGTSQPRLSSWESGSDRPAFDSIIKMQSVLDVDFNRLMNAIINVKG
jgi:hypothetical protein